MYMSSFEIVFGLIVPRYVEKTVIARVVYGESPYFNWVIFQR